MTVFEHCSARRGLASRGMNLVQIYLYSAITCHAQPLRPDLADVPSPIPGTL